MPTRWIKYIAIRLAFTGVLPAIPQSPAPGAVAPTRTCSVRPPAANLNFLAPLVCQEGALCLR